VYDLSTSRIVRTQEKNEREARLGSFFFHRRESMSAWSDRVERKKRLDGEILKNPIRVLPGFREIGKRVFADGAISRRHKELMALAVAVSQNCFD
jgi:alkylhydroperoxidase/carboxymuconolactone decarboxylase family protein YurZ